MKSRICLFSLLIVLSFSSVAQNSAGSGVIRFNVNIPTNLFLDGDNAEVRAALAEDVFWKSSEDEAPLLSTKDELVFKLVSNTNRWTKKGKELLVLDRIFLNAIGEVPLQEKIEINIPGDFGGGKFWTREIRLDLDIESDLLNQLKIE